MISTTKKLGHGAVALAAGIFATGMAHAGDSAAKAPVDSKAPVAEEKDCCDYFAIPPLYKNGGNPFLQELGFHGRYQGQYYLLDSDQGDNDDWENRRWRVGAHAKMFNFLTATIDINIDDEFNPFYKSIDEAYLKAEISESFNLTAGKFKPRWSTEWSTSSKKIITFERSLLVNQLLPDKASGVAADGKSGNFDYFLGVFSGDIDDEFGEFNEGTFINASMGYDFSGSTGLDKSRFHFDYLYNSTDANNAAAPYDHSFSTGVELQSGQFGLMTDLLYATGENDAYGVVVMPTYDITEKLQFVGRYQYAHGDNDSLRAQSRYERTAPFISDGGHGEDYNAFYAGLNYYICDHNLKLMSGIEYSDLDDSSGDGGDFSGWTWFNGVRLYF
jgi:phosphate-selective porin OprO/OprP